MACTYCLLFSVREKSQGGSLRVLIFSLYRGEAVYVHLDGVVAVVLKKPKKSLS